MKPADSKTDALRREGLLNPHPERVRDPAFQGSAFFDPRDLRLTRPRPRGPRKITPEIRRFAADYRRRHGRVGATRLARAIEAEFGLRLHPRSLERALPRTAKKNAREERP